MQVVFQPLVLVAASLTILVLPLHVQAQSPQGDRRLGIDLNEAEGVTYDDAIKLVKTLGAQSASISLNWDQIEPRPNEFVDPSGFLYLVDTYYPDKGVSIDLFIRCVDTDGRHVPSDLKEIPFNDVAMTERFAKLLDFVFSRIPNAKLNFVSIGNELTLAFPRDDDFWTEYETFYWQAKRHIKELRRDTIVGAVGTMYELIGSHKNAMQRLNQHSDVILVSYYPLNGDFSVKPASQIAKDISQLTTVYPKRTIYFSETGYPSSKLLRSSEQKQREYIKAVFDAWDIHAKQINYISFAWLHDQSEAQLDDFERYYGSSHPNFRAYLATLGLRHRTGKAKPAFDAIEKQCRSRGWKAK